MLEKFIETIKRLDPATKEKEDTKLLADNFETVKPGLRQLNVQVSSCGYPDGNKKHTFITLTFDQSNRLSVRQMLENVGIQDRGIHDKEGNPIQANEFTIFSGKYAEYNDVLRLSTLEPTVTK